MMLTYVKNCYKHCMIIRTNTDTSQATPHTAKPAARWCMGSDIFYPIQQGQNYHWGMCLLHAPNIYGTRTEILYGCLLHETPLVTDSFGSQTSFFIVKRKHQTVSKIITASDPAYCSFSFDPAKETLSIDIICWYWSFLACFKHHKLSNLISLTWWSSFTV